MKNQIHEELVSLHALRSFDNSTGEWGDALATSRRGRGIACLHVICPLSADRVLRGKHLVSRTDCAAEHADATRVCAQIGT